jgi:amidase
VLRVSYMDAVRQFDRNNKPVANVDPGQKFCLETQDALGAMGPSADGGVEEIGNPVIGNPATGPVYVNGAKPGGSIVVTVEKIDLSPKGVVGLQAGVGLLAHMARNDDYRILSVEGNEVVFSDRFRYPIRPMVGTIGTAPGGGPVTCMHPGAHGGNMDNNLIGEGARLHLPVYVDGALFAAGDVHASMGDGEISIWGLDFPAVVTVSIELEDEPVIDRPWIETPRGDWVTTGDDLDARRAMVIACEQMNLLLQRKLGVNFEDAYVLQTVIGDLGICQAADPGGFPVTTRFLMPASVVSR